MISPCIRFNDGRGCFLCLSCGVIIKENLTKYEAEGCVPDDINLRFCKECKCELEESKEEDK